MSRKKESGVLIENRRAHFEYFLSDFMTAGLVLTGTEIKSLRAKNATISDAYIFVKHGEAFVCNMHIAPYKEGNIFNVDHLRDRKLLLTKQEIKKAKRGVLPDDCNIHHKVPLSGSNDLMVNDFCNLTVLHKNTHEFINKYIFSPQLKPIQTAPFGSEIVIDVPNYDYVDKEGILKERAVRQQFRWFRKRER